MISSDFHLHTTFSDGNNTPEEMVQKAISLGLKSIGFSDHSYTFFDDSYCMKKENTENYIKTVAKLKQKYSNKINIYCGIEQDYYSTERTDKYDYIIGSVHYVKVADVYIPIDESAEILADAAKKYFGGNYIKLAEEYFKTVQNVVEKTGADVIGHFDLITKFNNSKLFDENDQRYITAYKGAVDKLLKTGKVFEINTGAIARGYKEYPYPSKEIIEYIKKMGGKFILSSDSHSINNICFEFDKWKNLL